MAKKQSKSAAGNAEAAHGHPETRDAAQQTYEEVREELAEVERQEEVNEQTETPREDFSRGFETGAEEAAALAAGPLPFVADLLHKGIYTSAFTLTYGFVFTSLVLGSFIPHESSVSKGIRDGRGAAQRDYRGHHAPDGAEQSADSRPGGEGYAGA